MSGILNGGIGNRLDGALAVEYGPKMGNHQFKSAHLTDNAKQDLKQVAAFMDKHPDVFGKPDSGSWAKELDEDNFLDDKETHAFEKGISMFKDAQPSGGGYGIGDDEGGGDDFSSSGSGRGRKSESLTGDPFIDELIKRLMGNDNEKSHTSPSKALAAADRLDGSITPKDGDESGDKGGYFSPESAKELKSVARYMDANPDKFGVPDSGSWTKELGEDNFLNKEEFNKFKTAIADVKDGIYDNAFGYGDGTFGSNDDAQAAGRSVVHQLFG
ncbi:hypothetical protein [Chitinimonas koreensis]|uniref:hypothetical protein n=1 Tax=Chitinimonas koreensis TaxID=356302 RepID=UPI0003F70377|nr:hypothetical protein [Chitinimonas koreensis]QNM97617.1 hypothetical protein H9L41_04775 [Chitinimonas koreensis]